MIGTVEVFARLRDDDVAVHACGLATRVVFTSQCQGKIEESIGAVEKMELIRVEEVRGLYDVFVGLMVRVHGEQENLTLAIKANPMDFFDYAILGLHGG